MNKFSVRLPKASARLDIDNDGAYVTIHLNEEQIQIVLGTIQNDGTPEAQLYFSSDRHIVVRRTGQFVYISKYMVGPGEKPAPFFELSSNDLFESLKHALPDGEF